ncbi:MAG: YdcF family protein [Desulfovibrio sp.]|nr:YdcF family protein [Desulfovibrio sp.]
MKRYWALLLQGVGTLTLLALVLGGTLVLTAGYWLRMDEQPRKADAIVILAGRPQRAIHAADLYLRGLAPVILLGRPDPGDPDELCSLGFDCTPQEEQMAKVLRAKGVPEGVLKPYGKGFLSTVEEAEGLARELGPEPKVLLVVTSAYHCRRAKMILSSALRGHEIIMTPTPYERFDRQWWKHQNSAGAVVSEVAKFIFYFLGTPFRANQALAG